MTKTEAIAVLMEWLEKQVGYTASEDKDNKYARNLDSIPGFYNTAKNLHDWCDVFVDDAFVECFGADAGMKMVRQPKESCGAGCYYSARYYQNAGALYSSPERGDQIFFGPDGDDHTGVVVDVRQNRVYTIEGNTGGGGGKVAKKEYSLSDNWIYKYGRPDWSVVADKALKHKADYEAEPNRIWNFLSAWIGNDFGTAGLIANLNSESGLIAANLQNSYERSLGMDDREYTEAVDNGTYKNFSSDSAGYGLAQWTYWSRKEALKKYTDSQDASIGNLDAQLGYLCREIEQSYKPVLDILRSAKSVYESSDAVMVQFERPADQSEANKQKRRESAEKFYEKYHGGTPTPEPEPEPTPEPERGKCKVDVRVLGKGDTGNDVKALQGILQANGFDLAYCGGCDGIFGNGTESAVMTYQQINDLAVDGVVGKQTWGCMLSN